MTVESPLAGIGHAIDGEVRITDPKTGGQKGQKPERFDLFPFDALEEVARVYGVGAQKYDDDNWLKGYRWRLSLGALLRHVARFALGEDRDAETGCLHMAHAAWHCLTLITFYLRGLGTDDRATPPREEVQYNGREGAVSFDGELGAQYKDGEVVIEDKPREPCRRAGHFDDCACGSGEAFIDCHGNSGAV